MYVLTLLIDVYSRRGCITEAYLVFISVAVKSIVLWNAMITGFSRYACVNESMILFEEMLQNGICLIAVMYISMLSACIHVGSIASGHYYFYQMTNAKNVQATVLHCSCMVVVLKRSAQIQETRELMENMSFQVTTSMWGPLLGVCRIHRDIKLAKVTAERLFELESENAIIRNQLVATMSQSIINFHNEVDTTEFIIGDMIALSTLVEILHNVEPPGKNPEKLTVWQDSSWKDPEKSIEDYSTSL
ncbi:hypothetical protein J5N97_001596 [Dioscorea zingiberensis]|uniref:Pentatricopeptide repeat-containing protein n=1 Tax=Dioscorea zingiberensis TaxID=325984 RepID=A0A9D5H284_9LILI|nr:hypothetical protein J5N97_001596 [Dioscorea zingiberensis]